MRVCVIFVGILAGIHPCGTITLVGELFGAKSKGQVYRHLHSYFFAQLTVSVRNSAIQSELLGGLSELLGVPRYSDIGGLGG